MPIQKGKRNKKPRRRGVSETAGSVSRSAAPSASPVRQKASAQGRRRGWQPPLWVNVMVGTGMVIFGIIQFFTQQHNAGMTGLVFLVLYFVIAGLYLGKAYQQYRAKQRG